MQGTSPILQQTEDKGCLIKRLTNQILYKVKQENKDIDLSFVDINYLDQSVVQGNNFISKLSQVQNNTSAFSRINTREPIGVGLYFEEKQEDNKQYFDIFIGQIINGKCKGPGIRMQIYLTFRKSVSQSINNSRSSPKITTQKHRVLYFKDWSLVDQGFYYYKDGVQEQTFKGLFVNQQTYKKGKLTIKCNGQTKSIYTGSFNEKNQAHGEGQLQIPGQYRYNGQFSHNNKDGFGQEEDFCRCTRYVGDFYMNEKSGYGQLTYGVTFGKKKENNSSSQGKEEKQKRKKVKGYWKNGVAIEGKAIIVDEMQNASEILKRSHYRKS